MDITPDDNKVDEISVCNKENNDSSACEDAQSINSDEKPNEVSPKHDQTEPTSDVNDTSKTTFEKPKPVQKHVSKTETEILSSKPSYGPVKAPVIPYNEPSWGSRPPDNLYALEVIKNGCLKCRIELGKKSYAVFGRLSSCDVVIDHPSSSRYHAVLQYKGTADDRLPEGYYVWDLASTHGTFVNKSRIKPNTYVRVHTGFVLKFGGSTRLYMLQGPEDDQQEEGNMAAKANSSKSAESSDGKSPDADGITWGIREDAVEEEVDIESILKRKKPLELKDPKKTFRGFFEREGLDLEYGVEEQGSGNSKVYVTRVSLPIDTPNGEEVFAEGRATNKKQSVLQCATDGCRILDAYDMLRSVQHESETGKRVKQLAENDFYDSDEDSFTDRTGQVEKKRLKRIARYNKSQEATVQTFESLNEKLIEIDRSLCDLRAVLKKAENAEREDSEKDSLDAFMSSIDARIDKKVKTETKRKIAELEKERSGTLKLIEIARPTALPALLNASPSPPVPSAQKNQEQQDDRAHSSVPAKEEVADEPSTKSDGIPTGDKKTSSTSKAERSSSKQLHDKETKNQSQASSTAPQSDHFKVPAGLPVSTKPSPAASKRKSSESAGGHLKPALQKQTDGATKTKKKKKRVIGPSLPWKSSATDSKYSDWTPPEGQSGDGKTSLNEKFGY